MAKSSGLGDNFYIGGYDLSGDVGSLGTISNSVATLETTGINKSAMERLTGQRNGTIEFTSFFNDAALQEHVALKSLPTTDRIATYARGTTLGNQAACMVCKQINYDGTRAADGAFTFNVQALSNAYGIEWGNLLTAGVATATGAGNQTSIDTGGSLSFGAQIYLQVFAFSGTDATVKVQDSADNAAFATIQFMTQTTTAPGAERIALSNTSTVRRYVRAAIDTAGGFSSLSFAVVIVKNDFAGLVF